MPAIAPDAKFFMRRRSILNGGACAFRARRIGRDVRTVENRDSRQAEQGLPNVQEWAERPAFSAICADIADHVTDFHLNVSFRHLSDAHDSCDR
jgi:hypothetical protein